MHHRLLTELLLRADVSMSHQPNVKKRVAQALRATTVYDRARLDSMVTYERHRIEAMERLADLLDPKGAEQ
jgi:hypothetical protein